MILRSLQSLAALPPSTKVYCAHEYTLSNLAFAQVVEPDNAALANRIAAAEATRQRGEPTLPSDIALELATNPFLGCNDKDLQTSLHRQRKLRADSAVEVFSAVRGWKDNF
jgi:hydroxyacylglutathione hydrolase